MKVSERFSLNRKDWIDWGKNALIFLAPALIVLVGSTIEALPKDWKYATIALYILNRLTALLRLFIVGPKK